MASVSTEEIKKLRETTGVSVMECKKALEEAEGDMEKAQVILRKKSSAAAAKKADRELGAGTVASYIHASKDVGAMVVLSCETDFVSKNPEFEALAYDIALHITASAPEFISRTQVTDEATQAAREVFAKEAADKPERCGQRSSRERWTASSLRKCSSSSPSSRTRRRPSKTSLRRRPRSSVSALRSVTWCAFRHASYSLQ